ncbi:MAG: GNAT family N-acetyltransferase [Marmoricola sp.]
MTADLTVDVVSGADWGVVERLHQLYVHDLSEFRGTLPAPTGRFVFKNDRYTPYVEDVTGDHAGYLAWQDDHPVGFALVHGILEGPRMIGHFFVARGLRRTGTGRALALDVIARHERPWQIAFQEENPGAARFWRRIAGEAFGDDWHEERRPVPGKPQIPPDVWIIAGGSPQ